MQKQIEDTLTEKLYENHFLLDCHFVENDPSVRNEKDEEVRADHDMHGKFKHFFLCIITVEEHFFRTHSVCF